MADQAIISPFLSAPRFRGPLFLLRFLRLGSVIVPLALLGLWGWQSWIAAHDQALREARKNVELVREHIHKVIQTQERVLAHVDDMIAGMSWLEIAQSQALRRRLSALAGTVDSIAAIELIDAGGYRRSGSIDPAASVNISDQDYFIGLQGFDYPLYIGERAVGRVGDIDVVPVAQRRGGGGFDGIIVAAVHAGSLLRFFRGIADDERTAIGLIRRDGRVLARVPVRNPVTLSARSPMYAAMAQADSGTFNTVAEADGIARSYAYGRVGDLPLYVTFGIADGTIAGRWREEMALGGGAALLLSLLAFALTSLLVRQTRADAVIRERLETEIGRRTAELTEALADKDVLLREVHHRVKNNFQVIASLLRIQLRLGNDPWEGLRQSLTRIHSMGLVHQQLYQTADLSRLDLLAYLRTLVEHLHTAQGGELRAISSEVSGEPAAITLDEAIPIALIVSEVLSNAFKHAFPQGRAGHVAVHVVREDGVLAVQVRDDGIGRPPNPPSNTLGLRLIDSLAGQLGATYAFESGGGTTFTLRVPQSAAAHADAA